MSKDKRTGWIADIKVGDTITWSNLWKKSAPHPVACITPSGQISCLIERRGDYREYIKFTPAGQAIGQTIERVSIDKPKAVTDAEP